MFDKLFFQFRNYVIIHSTNNIAWKFSLFGNTNLKYKDIAIFISSFCYFQEM